MEWHTDIVMFLTVEKHYEEMHEQHTPIYTHGSTNWSQNIVNFFILEMHCDSTSRNANNHTALHLTTKKGHLRMVQFLNCDPNLPRGHYSRTPLLMVWPRAHS